MRVIDLYSQVEALNVCCAGLTDEECLAFLRQHGQVRYSDFPVKNGQTIRTYFFESWVGLASCFWLQDGQIMPIYPR